MNESTSFLPELQKATGHFDYPMTNDYMFRALCQKNNKALTGLISALLRIPVEKIHSVVITNPIILGDACEDKEFRLDIRIVLNEKTIMNLEMQVSNLYDWPERSVSYLSRIYDSLFRGEEYANVKSAMHIGILDFTLFPEYPEFYASNMIMNEKTYRIYSDKFALNVLDLSKVELATDEDKAWKLDYWARLFKATTWEEIKMIASNDDYLKEASNTLYLLNEDFNIRERCRNRIEYYSVLDRYESMIEQKDAEIEQKDLEIKQLYAEIEQLKAGKHN